MSGLPLSQHRGDGVHRPERTRYSLDVMDSHEIRPRRAWPAGLELHAEVLYTGDEVLIRAVATFSVSTPPHPAGCMRTRA